MSDKSIEEWKTRLIGKKYVLDNVSVASEEQDKVVHKTDLPAEHRIIPPNAFTTMDYKPERLNVYIDNSSTITNVKFG